MPGIDRALVIAGSDKRGTIYGIYDLSSADRRVAVVLVGRRAGAARRPRSPSPRGRVTQGEPAVKYRGIFINDEAPAFSGWTREKFGGVNHLVYEKVFELILRLKGNYLWPAMWGNAFTDDDSLNPALADRIRHRDGHVAPRADDARAAGVAALRQRRPWNYEHERLDAARVLARGHPAAWARTRTSSRSACAATATCR